MCPNAVVGRRAAAVAIGGASRTSDETWGEPAPQSTIRRDNASIRALRRTFPPCGALRDIGTALVRWEVALDGIRHQEHARAPREHPRPETWHT